MNAVAKYLRDEIALVEKSKTLGIFHRIDHDKALLVYRRAAEEIERLTVDREVQGALTRIALGDFDEVDMATVD